MKLKNARSFATCALTVVFAASVVLLNGCTNESSPSSTNTEGSSSTTQSVSFNLGHLNSTAHVLGFVAKEEGYFKDEGLDVTLNQLASGSELVSGLESKKLDAAFIGSVPTITAQSSGHDVSIFGGAMSNGHGYVIDSKYTDGLDKWDVTILKGKTVALPRNAIQELELLQILKHYGLTYAEDGSADVKLVYFDSQKDAYSALASPEIDAASCYSPYTAIAVDNGYSIVYRCSEEDIFKNQPCCRQVALTSALNEDPEKYESFERALIKAYDFFKNNPDKTVADVKKYIDIPESQIKFELYEGDYADSNPDPDKIATTTLKDDAVAFGYTKDYNIDNYYNTSIYAAALESLIAIDPNNKTYQNLRAHYEQAD